MLRYHLILRSVGRSLWDFTVIFAIDVAIIILTLLALWVIYDNHVFGVLHQFNKP